MPTLFPRAIVAVFVLVLRIVLLTAFRPAATGVSWRACYLRRRHNLRPIQTTNVSKTSHGSR